MKIASLDMPVRIGISPALGIRGVLAARDIEAGEVIERSPLILIPAAQESTVKQTIFSVYYYEWSATHFAFALGYGSLYNHSYQPNAYYEFDEEALRLVFIAYQNISAGQEITVNYNGDPHDDTPLEAKYVGG
jgi:SET domain-containing protein